jgi:hypothetical protein
MICTRTEAFEANCVPPIARLLKGRKGPPLRVLLQALPLFPPRLIDPPSGTLTVVLTLKTEVVGS